MMTSFSFSPILRGLSLPKRAVTPTRAVVGALKDEHGQTVYLATLFDASGVGRVHCTDRSPESALRGALLGLLAAVARVTNEDVSEAQAYAVRLTLS